MAISKTSWAVGKSGNPAGRKRNERSISQLLAKRLDKEEFVENLIAIARGGEGIDISGQLTAMRLVLSYLEGLPVSRAEVGSTGPEALNIQINYVETHAPNHNRTAPTTLVPAIRH